MSKFNVGDRVMGFGNMTGLDIIGRIGTIIYSTEQTISGNSVIYSIVDFDEKFSNCLWDGKKYYVSENLLRHLDTHWEEKQKIREKELKLKYITIDPYGEENWDE